MKIRALYLSLIAIAGMLAFPARADTKRYRISLKDDAAVGAQQLRAGGYKLEVSDASKVTLTHAQGESVELNATIETADQKYNSTAIHYNTVDGTRQITQINIGGTNVKVSFPEP